jgi:hypothetical protein
MSMAGIPGRLPVVTIALFIVLLGSDGVFPCLAAGGVSGYAELTYADRREETRLADSSIKADSQLFLQRYSLTVDSHIYPLLRLRAGGTYETTDTERSTDLGSSDSTLTRVNEFIDLNLTGRLLSGTAGYRRREVESEADGLALPKEINEVYSARLSWRPADLPEVDLLLSRAERYDAERVSRDSVTDQLQLGVRYNPNEAVTLDYRGIFTQTDNRITETESESVTNNIVLAYQQQFLDNRLQLYARNNFNHRENSTAVTRTSGTVLLPVAGFEAVGLAALSPLLGGAETVTLARLESLANDNFVDNGGAVTNLGTQPALLSPADRAGRNLGLDFGFSQVVNTLRVWIDRELPADIADRLRWEVYASVDNQNWQPLTAGAAPAPYDRIEGYFELRTFPEVATRYLKVVVEPLPVGTTSTLDPTFDPADIYAAELKGYRDTPASEVRDTSTTTWNDNLDVNLRYRLHEKYALYYDLSVFYSYRHTETDNQYRYTVTNAVSGNHPLSARTMLSARVMREDSREANGATLAANMYTASLQVTPLPTLSHTINISGRIEEGGDDPATTHALSLNNFAELYTGVDLSLGAGFSKTRRDSGLETDAASLAFGATLEPLSTLTVTAGYFQEWSQTQGGGRPDREDESSNASLAISYRPFEALSLYGALSYTTEQDRDDQTTWDVNASWAVLRRGDLLLNCSYTRTETTPGGQMDWAFIPSARWKFRRGAYLDVSYSWEHSEIERLSTDTETFLVSLRMTYN